MDVHPRVLVISANLGGFDKPEPHAKQEAEGYKIEYFTWDDENFQPRVNSMTPRLQARIPKMMAWQMKPNYDYYLWIDSSCRMSRTDTVKWFLEQLDDKDIAVLKHPNRNTVGEEADYLRARLKKKCPYITPRYAGERLDDQMAVVDPTAQLYASTAFIYKNDTRAQDALTIWWLHTSLYHSIDQLSLPAAIAHAGATYAVIDEDYMKSKYIEFTRVKK